MANVQKKTTIYDIAKECNVSIATVSRVLNNADYPVKLETKALIKAAAQRLCYTPNLLGKNLKFQSSKDIGIIVPNVSNSYYTTLLQGIYDHAIERDYNIILCNSYRDAHIEEKNIDILMQKQVGGIIIVSINENVQPIRQAMQFGCKVVVVEQDVDMACSKVGFNFHKGGYLAAAHLIENGHRRIGFVGAPLDRRSRIDMLQGYKDCLAQAGIPIVDEYISLENTESELGEIFEFKNGRHAVQKFLQLAKRPTGYVTLNDMTAMGVIREFAKNGYSVPEDISVVGFDNIPFCEVISPELTTVDQCAYDMGNMATKTLIDEIEHKSRVNISIILEPTLVRRKTVAKPREE